METRTHRIFSIFCLLVQILRCHKSIQFHCWGMDGPAAGHPPGQPGKPARGYRRGTAGLGHRRRRKRPQTLRRRKAARCHRPHPAEKSGDSDTGRSYLRAGHQNRKPIQGELLEIDRSHTSLIIAHRLSTVVEADEILVIEARRIIERGRHPELLAKNGVYAAMWSMQQQA